MNSTENAKLEIIKMLVGERSALEQRYLSPDFLNGHIVTVQRAPISFEDRGFPRVTTVHNATVYHDLGEAERMARIVRNGNDAKGEVVPAVQAARERLEWLGEMIGYLEGGHV